MIRIIAGQFRSRRLVTPDGLDTRPTLDRVREALFSILGDRVPDARIVDLFAGSGAIGLEALSRGAHHATFVESAPTAVRALRSNVESLKIETANFTLAQQDALVFLNANIASPADILFADPPYRTELLQSVVSAITPSHIAKNGLIVIQHAAQEQLPAIPMGLTLADQRTYGKTALSFLTPED